MPKAPKKLKPVFAARPPQQQQQQRAPKKPKQPNATQAPHKPSQSASKHLTPALKRSSSGSHGSWQCSSVIDQQSSEVLDKLLLAAETRRGGATIKSLTLAPHIVHKKPTFAVTCETLKHLPLLKQLVEAVGLLQQHRQQLTPAAAYVLTYEVLFGQGFRRKGPAEKAVLKHKEVLKSGLQQLLQDADVQDAAGWLQATAQQQQPQSLMQQPTVQHPRHARVNTLKADVQQVLQQLRGAGSAGRHSSGSTNSSAGGDAGYDVQVDELLPDLLVFPPGTDLHDHPLVEQGVLILQSKASCMPAHALQPGAGWHLVDCCAAPGNKTTHAAALLAASTAAAAAAAGAGAGTASSQPRSQKKRSRQDSNAGPVQEGSAVTSCSDIKVFAFDKDPKRVKRLAANVERAGAAGIVSAQRADFLSIDPCDPQFAKVKGVILDPSCSGSGTTVSRMDHLLPGSSSTAGAASELDEQEQQRVEQLAKFQETALLHALQFPALQRLVYSTCSIHQRENEDVVAAVLPAATAAGFRLVDPFPSWHRRGLPVVEGAELLVRTDAHADGTDGFFVAVFERSGEGVVQAEQQQQEQAVLQEQQQELGPQQGSKPKKKKKRGQQ